MNLFFINMGFRIIGYRRSVILALSVAVTAVGGILSYNLAKDYENSIQIAALSTNPHLSVSIISHSEQEARNTSNKFLSHESKLFVTATPSIRIVGKALISVVKQDGTNEYSDFQMVNIIGYPFDRLYPCPADIASIYSKHFINNDSGNSPIKILESPHPKDKGRVIISESFQKTIFSRPMPTGNDFIINIQGINNTEQSIIFKARTAGAFIDNPLSLREKIKPIYCRLDELQNTFHVNYYANRIDFRLSDPHNVEYAIKIVHQLIPGNYEIKTWVDFESESLRIISFLKAGVIISVVLVLLMSFVSLSAIFNMVVYDKRKSIASLLAMGCSSKFILLTFSSIGFIIGIVGTSVGIIFGYIVTILSSNKLHEILAFLYHRNSDSNMISLNSLYFTILFLCLVCISSTFYSVLYAIKIKPADLLRSE